MTAITLKSNVQKGLLTQVFIVVLGIGIIALAGHVQTAALHNAAHDMRHAIGFPCH